MWVNATVRFRIPTEPYLIFFKFYTTLHATMLYYLGRDAALINHPPILLSNNVVEGLAEGLKVLLLGRTHTPLGLLEL